MLFPAVRLVEDASYCMVNRSASRPGLCPVPSIRHATDGLSRCLVNRRATQCNFGAEPLLNVDVQPMPFTVNRKSRVQSVAGLEPGSSLCDNLPSHWLR